jgi:hypothetical protein
LLLKVVGKCSSSREKRKELFVLFLKRIESFPVRRKPLYPIPFLQLFIYSFSILFFKQDLDA